MSSAVFSSDAPHHNLTNIAVLAADLRSADYTNDAIELLLGALAASALAEDDPVPATVVLGTTTASPLATLIRWWFLGETLPAVALEEAFPTLGVEGLQDLNLLVRQGEGYRAQFDVRPYGVDGQNYWVASDLGAMVVNGPLRKDYVLGIGQASLTLAHATVRTPAATALDIGTGCGVQALHLLGHCEHVTVTDISTRALAFAKFNFLLNKEALGLDDALSRITFVHGSLLEPLVGKTFDVIVTNPPFVITPRTGQQRYEYRDGGQEGDAIVAELIRELPQFLTPGGHAQMLANWEIRENQQLWFGRIQSWLPENTNVWVVQRDIQTGPEYARMWLKDASESQDLARYRQAYADYAADFGQRNVSHIGFGLVYLGKPHNETDSWQWYEELTAPVHPPLGVTIGDSVAAIGALKLTENLGEFTEQEVGRVGELRLIPAPDVTYEQHRRLGAEEPEVILLRQGGGFGRVQALSSAAAGIVSACDGEFTVAELAAGYQSLLPEPDQFDVQSVLGEIGRLYIGALLKDA